MDQDAAKNLAVVLAAVVGVSLALVQAVGPLLVYLTEAVKATGRIREGYSGIVALVLGIGLGASLGWLTDSLATDERVGTSTMVGLGAFGGALMAAGAIKTYKAMGDVNTQAAPERTDMATMADLDAAVSYLSNNQSYGQMSPAAADDESELEPLQPSDFAPMTTTPLTPADMAAMQAELEAHDAYQSDPATPNVLAAPPLPAAEPEA